MKSRLAPRCCKITKACERLLQLKDLHHCSGMNRELSSACGVGVGAGGPKRTAPFQPRGGLYGDGPSLRSLDDEHHDRTDQHAGDSDQDGGDEGLR